MEALPGRKTSAPSVDVDDFIACVRRVFDSSRPQSFWACEELFTSLLANVPAVQDRLNKELNKLAKEPTYLGDWLPNEWVLHQGDGFVLSVSLSDPTRRFIHVLPFYAFYGSLGDAGLNYELYGLPPNYRNEVFDPGVRLQPLGTRSVAPGEPIKIDSDVHAYDFRASQSVPMLKFMSTAVRTLEWLFSADTLAAWQANDAYLPFTQLRVAADVLGKFAHQSSLEPLKQLSEHPHHAVRWSAIQNLARVNRSEAIARLQRAVADPHPHIRSAAAKTLDRLARKTR